MAEKILLLHNQLSKEFGEVYINQTTKNKINCFTVLLNLLHDNNLNINETFKKVKPMYQNGTLQKMFQDKIETEFINEKIEEKDKKILKKENQLLKKEIELLKKEMESPGKKSKSVYKFLCSEDVEINL